jgi:hypothetical protein
MKLFYKILFYFLGKGLFSLPLHNPGRITSILTHINTFISELVFSLGERLEEFRMPEVYRFLFPHHFRYHQTTTNGQRLVMAFVDVTEDNISELMKSKDSKSTQRAVNTDH